MARRSRSACLQLLQLLMVSAFAGVVVRANDPAPVCSMEDNFLPVLLLTAECRDFFVEGQAHQRLVNLRQAAVQDFHAYGPAGCTCLQEVSASTAGSYLACRFGADFGETLLDYFEQSGDNCAGERT